MSVTTRPKPIQWVNHTIQELIDLQVVVSADPNAKDKHMFKDLTGKSVNRVRIEGCITCARQLGRSILYTVRDNTAEITVKYCHANNTVEEMKMALNTFKESNMHHNGELNFDGGKRSGRTLAFLLRAVEQDVKNTEQMFADGVCVRVVGKLNYWMKELNVVAEYMHLVATTYPQDWNKHRKSTREKSYAGEPLSIL